MKFKKNEHLILLRFGELWLKKGNRSSYIRTLERNIKEQLSGENFTLQRDFDRLLVRLNKNSDTERITAKLRKVFGIRIVEDAIAVQPNLKEIAAASKKLLSSKPLPKSVKINSHRSYKQLSFNSRDIVDKLKIVSEKLGIDPTTKGYEREINVNVTKDAAFLSLHRYKGAGGLPVGTSGKAVILLSGGIDSPVAAWYAMKRGLEPIYVHIHAFQKNEEAERGKVPRLARILSSFYPHSKTYLVPSYLFQASSFRFGKYELILLKAFMLRLAEKIAEKESVKVIFTGESLGQVASQTPENLGAEQYGLNIPVLRPLIGYDKEEIINMAREIGTYEESIKPYRDVCSLNARNPKLRSEQREIGRMLAKMKINAIIKRSLKSSSLIVL